MKTLEEVSLCPSVSEATALVYEEEKSKNGQKDSVTFEKSTEIKELISLYK